MALLKQCDRCKSILSTGRLIDIKYGDRDITGLLYNKEICDNCWKDFKDFLSNENTKTREEQ